MTCARIVTRGHATGEAFAPPISVEGPSLVIAKEELTPFLGKKILKVSGNTKQPKELIKSRTLSRIETWGKVLFLFFAAPRRPTIVTKTHFMMFGSYRIDDPRPNRVPRVEMKFKNGIVYFYACSFQMDAEEIFENLDRRVDVLSPDWDEKYVVKLMKKKTKEPLCDLLLDQTVFAGSGNIVKNEVLFNLRRHPLTPLAKIASKDWPKIAQATRQYCENFYKWKKKFELRQHWQVYAKSRCPLCDGKIKREHLGKFKRRTFYCPKHQPMGVKGKALKAFDVLPIKSEIKPEARLDH